ncbi:MAG: hypothetical protein II595_10225, partial [Desulfovibrio sp.]|nr:hypothetical protein [Desulfovibrio sp.]
MLSNRATFILLKFSQKSYYNQELYFIEFEIEKYLNKNAQNVYNSLFYDEKSSSFSFVGLLHVVLLLHDLEGPVRLHALGDGVDQQSAV